MIDLVEVLRGNVVESRHAGALMVMDADGGVVWSLGDGDAPVFPRSAVKALQALSLVESGAADRFSLTPEMLALACASHGGEPGHVETAQNILAAAGLDETALECGCHWPSHRASARALAEEGRTPSALHNNCSGKHAGFLCFACAMDAPVKGYVKPDHPVQREVRAALESITGFAHEPALMGIDGCSIPTYAVPLRHLALAFARFGTGHGLAPERAKAAKRLREAVAAHPWHVAGTDRFCTGIMTALGPRAFVKTGAEGVFCGCLPEQSLGFAVKCTDGGTRAAEVITAAILARFLPDAGDLTSWLRPTLTNWNGITVGSLRPSAALIGPHSPR